MLSNKAIQEYKDIYKKEYGRDLTDAEAREQGERLAQLADIFLDMAITDHKRKLRLKKEKIKGFYLDVTEGPYTCSICGESYPGNEIWWNLKGLRCRDCWRNIQLKVIPNLTYDLENKVWIKDWQLHSDYDLHPATKQKLRRQGVLNGRDLKRSDGSIYCTIYLVKENEVFLQKFPKKPKFKVTYTDILGKQVPA